MFVSTQKNHLDDTVLLRTHNTVMFKVLSTLRSICMFMLKNSLNSFKNWRIPPVKNSSKLNTPYSKTCLKRPLKKKQKLVFKIDYCLMQVKSIVECCFIKLPFVIKIFVLSFFEWPFYTSFTVSGN